jgi:AraC family transcriptional activator of tynA and feaB
MLPYQAKFLSGSKLLVLKVSRCELEARVGNGRDLVALSIKPISAEAKVISEVLGMLPTYTELASSGVQEITGNYAIDLMAISLALSFDTYSPRLSSAKALVLSRVRVAVEARLTQPDLDTDQIAAAIGVTARYDNAVLGQQGTSIFRLIQERRLERCRAALEDPFQKQRNVSDIAYAWGFSDMTHFGRAFKKRFGISPREYRRVCKD